MRAHLLQTMTNEREDAQLDRAANDADFATASDAPKADAIRAVPIASPIAPRLTCDNDHYWLGGYAGI